MKESNFEQLKSRLEDPGFFEKFKNAVADRLEDLVTDQAVRGANLSLDLPENLRNGQKIERSGFVEGAIVAIGQDFRLTPDEIDKVKDLFLESQE